jgi:hypothetical protein
MEAIANTAREALNKEIAEAGGTVFVPLDTSVTASGDPDADPDDAAAEAERLRLEQVAQGTATTANNNTPEDEEQRRLQADAAAAEERERAEAEERARAEAAAATSKARTTSLDPQSKVTRATQRRDRRATQAFNEAVSGAVPRALSINQGARDATPPVDPQADRRRRCDSRSQSTAYWTRAARTIRSCTPTPTSRPSPPARSPACKAKASPSPMRWRPCRRRWPRSSVEEGSAARTSGAGSEYQPPREKLRKEQMDQVPSGLSVKSGTTEEPQASVHDTIARWRVSAARWSEAGAKPFHSHRS